MIILAFDTSGHESGVAVVKNNAVVGEISVNAKHGGNNYTHSETLLPAAENLLKFIGLTPSDPDYIAYTNGPGSFTGLRIGASSALGMAKALKIPAVAIPTLDALAYNVRHTGKNRCVVPMLDARRGQVYFALYYQDENGNLHKKTDYSVQKAVEVDLPEGCEMLFLGDGADSYKTEIMQIYPTALFAPPHNSRTRASSVALSALERINNSETLEMGLIYVRQPQAVRERACGGNNNRKI